MKWELKTVSDVEWQRDTSGLYALINWRMPEDDVRIDVMTSDDMPLVSFVGPTDGVRKHLMRWLVDTGNVISIEHAAYIGAELEKAGTMRIDYVQDDNSHKCNRPQEHNPDTCGCKYIGHNMWNCGHIDGDDTGLDADGYDSDGNRREYIA